MVQKLETREETRTSPPRRGRIRVAAPETPPVKTEESGPSEAEIQMKLRTLDIPAALIRDAEKGETPSFRPESPEALVGVRCLNFRCEDGMVPQVMLPNGLAHALCPPCQAAAMRRFGRR